MRPGEPVFYRSLIRSDARLTYTEAHDILEGRARDERAGETLELADRLAAVPGRSDYGLLSATAQLYSEVEKLFTLPPGAFSPPPKVESSVVRLRMVSKLESLEVPEAEFIPFLKTGCRRFGDTIMFCKPAQILHQ